MLANGTRTSTTYDSAGREMQVLHLQSDNTTIAYFDYTYDLASRRTKVETHDDVVTWTYDATHQLLSEESTGVTEFHYTYTYDANGNRETKDDEGALTTCTYNGANQLLTQEALSGTTTYTYDKAGNQETIEEPSGDITTRTWDCENYITQVEQPTGDLHTFTYNGDQQRVRKDDGTDEVMFLWDGENILQETDDTNTVEVEYALEPAQYGNLISQHRDTETSYYHFDALGSTRLLIDHSEVITDTYTYNAHGKEVSQTGSTNSPYRWVGRRGYYFDETTDNFLVRRRQYNANTGTFSSADPFGVSTSEINLYRYVGNNFTNETDPSGLDPNYATNWHHLLPTEHFDPSKTDYLKQNDIDIDIGDKKYGWMLKGFEHQGNSAMGEKGVHSGKPEWNDDWAKWLEEREGKFTEAELDDRIKEMKKEHGLINGDGEPIKGKPAKMSNHGSAATSRTASGRRPTRGPHER